MASKLVVMPKTALNLSACLPVFAGAPSAAASADAQVFRAVSSAPQELTRVSHINFEILSMF